MVTRKRTYGFKCQTCGKMFSTRKELLDHTSTSHISKDKTPDVRFPKIPGPGDVSFYKCRYCGRSFSSPQSVAAHEYSCTEKP